ncbi:low temperature requirement protein A [Nostoc sp. FACHB-110]|uniref:low temperature requirement protein A n=1 Tax=Nostoc sp. FACHB-110 TaxID=2692834 RepID=UPI001689F3E7|nr:low temperature requirement protein A [Nostoc sp. FACHB-110]MBD2435885.1 low temperature requirement protein A [Nostoc sp. FACHB-110]
MRKWLKSPELRISEDLEAERHATWLELFFDLFFVVVISELAHNLSRDVSLSGFLSFLMLFVPIWWSWIGATFYANLFDTDDLGHRLLIGLQMLAVAALAVNVHDGMSKSSVGFALCYVVIRLLLVIEFLRAGKHITTARPLTNRIAFSSGLGALIWLMSVFVPLPLRFGFWILALTLEFAIVTTAGKSVHVELAPHASHLPERFGLFTLIVLGEAVLAVVNGVAQQEWHFSSVYTAVFGLSIAFSLWWLYFDNLGGSAIQAARACRHIGAYQTWVYMHLPLVIGITATGVGVEHAIANDLGLGLAIAERWLICASLALCFFTLGIIYLTGLSTDPRLRCKVRAGYRFVAAAIILALAVAGRDLSAMELIGIIAGVSAVQIILDLRQATNSFSA